MVADQLVAPGGCKGQHQTFPKLLALKLLHLNGAVVQRGCPTTLRNWRQGTIAWGGGKTSSMC